MGNFKDLDIILQNHGYVRSKKEKEEETTSGASRGEQANALMQNTVFKNAPKTEEERREKVNSILSDYRNSSFIPENKPVQKTSVVKKDNFGNWLKKQAEAGLSTFNKGLFSTLDFILPTEFMGKYDFVSKANDYYSNLYDNYTSKAQESSKSRGKGWEIAGELVSGSVAALPNAILAYMTAGTSLAGSGASALGTAAAAASTAKNASAVSKAAGLVGQTVRTMMKNPLYWTSAMQTLGLDYEEAKERGANDLVASASAIITTALNAGIEIGGGIEELPKNLKKGGKNAIIKWAESMLDEGKEEVLQGITTNAMAKLMYDNDSPIFSTNDDNAVINPLKSAKEFGMGAAVGGILGSGQAGLSNILNTANITKTGKYFNKPDIAKAIIDTGLNKPKDTKAYELAEKANKRNGKISNYDLGRLYYENLGQIDVGNSKADNSVDDLSSNELNTKTQEQPAAEAVGKGKRYAPQASVQVEAVEEDLTAKGVSDIDRENIVTSASAFENPQNKAAQSNNTVRYASAGASEQVHNVEQDLLNTKVSDENRAEIVQTAEVLDRSLPENPTKTVSGVMKNVTWITNEAVMKFRRETGKNPDYWNLYSENLKIVSSPDSVFTTDFIRAYSDSFAKIITESTSSARQVFSGMTSDTANETQAVSDAMYDYVMTGVIPETVSDVTKFENLVSKLINIIQTAATSNAYNHNQIYGENPVLSTQVLAIENGDFSVLLSENNSQPDLSEQPLQLTKVGDFYQAYGDTAQVFVDEFGLIPSYSTVNGERTIMVGFPDFALDGYAQRLGYSAQTTDGGAVLIPNEENTEGGAYGQNADSKYMDSPVRVSDASEIYNDVFYGTDGSEIRLTFDEKNAIIKYKSSSAYEMNDKIREGKVLSEEDKKFIADLNSALDKFPDYKGVVYRNIGLKNREEFDAVLNRYMHSYQENSVITEETFTSSSKSTDGYMVDRAKYKVHFLLNSKTGKDISNLGLEEESEVLFKSPTKFDISAVRADGNEIFIKGTERVENDNTTMDNGQNRKRIERSVNKPKSVEREEAATLQAGTREGSSADIGVSEKQSVSNDRRIGRSRVQDNRASDERNGNVFISKGKTQPSGIKEMLSNELDTHQGAYEAENDGRNKAGIEGKSGQAANSRNGKSISEIASVVRGRGTEDDRVFEEQSERDGDSDRSDSGTNNGRDERENRTVGDPEGNVLRSLNRSDITSVVAAMEETFKPGAVDSVSRVMQEKTGDINIELFTQKLIEYYNENGSLGTASVFFSDNGKKVAEAIEDIAGDVKYSISDDVQPPEKSEEEFKKSYDKWVSDGRPDRQSITVGMTSDALQSIGIKKQKITWDTSKINKSLKKHKYINDSILKQIPEMLENPIIIMKSKKSDSRITIFGEVYDGDGLPVMTVLELLPTNRDKSVVLDEIKIVSTHSRKAENNPGSILQTQNIINTSEILYVEPNKKRTDSWLTANRLQLPLAVTNYGSIKSITYPNGNVNSYNMQTPEKNVRSEENLGEEFKKSYDKWVKNGRRSDISLTIGRTSEALKSIGIKDQNITWDTGKINKILNKHQNMSDDIIKQIPVLLEKPIIVMQSLKSDSRITVLGELYDKNNKPVLTILELNPTNRNNIVLDEIKIASAYGKGNIQSLINRSTILYVEPNKKRTDNWMVHNRLQLPLDQLNYGSIKSITYPNGNVNSYNMQNEKNNVREDNDGRNDILSGNGERGYNEGSGEQAQRISAFERAAEGRTLSERKSTAQKILEQGQTEQKRIKNVRIDVIEKGAYNDDMRSISERLERGGISVEFFVGRGDVAFDNRRTFSVNGFAVGKNKLYLRYDAKTAPQKLALHELIHINWNSDETVRAKDIIMQGLTEAEKNRILKSERYKNYMEIYRGNEDAVWQEFVADVLAGMNDYSAGYIDIAADYHADSGFIDSYSPAGYAESIDAGGNKYSLNEDIYIPYNESRQLREYIMSVNNRGNKLRVTDCKEIGNNFYVWKNNSRTDYELLLSISIDGNEDLIDLYRSEIDGADRTREDIRRMSGKYDAGQRNGVGSRANTERQSASNARNAGFYIGASSGGRNPDGGGRRSTGESGRDISDDKIDNSLYDDINYSIDSYDTQELLEMIAEDIGYHEKLTEAVRKNKREVIALVRENKSLQRRLENARRQMTLTKAPHVNRAAAGKLTKDIIKELHGTIKAADIRDRVISIYDEYFMSVKKAGRVTDKLAEAADIMVGRFTDVAADIVDSAKAFTEDEDYLLLKSWLQATRISVPEWAKADADYTVFRKANMGTFNLTNDGIPLDSAYQELCEIFPHIFKRDVMQPSDQLKSIKKALDSLKPEEYNPHADYVSEAVGYAVDRFISEADGLGVMPDTKADKLAKKAAAEKAAAIENEREKFNRKFERYKAKNDERIDKLKDQIKQINYTRFWERQLSAAEKQQAIKNLRDRQKKAVIKADIRRIVSDMRSKLNKTEKAGGYPKELVKAAAEICSVIDFHTGRVAQGGGPTKASLKLDALKAEYDNLANNENYDIKSEYSKELSDYIAILNNSIKGKRVVDLTTQELGNLKNILSEISHRLSNASKQIGIDKAVENRAVGAQVINDWNKRTDLISGDKNRLLKYLRSAGADMSAFVLNPNRINEMLAGYDRKSAWWGIYEQINRGVRKAAKFTMDATKPFDELTKGNGGNEVAFFEFRTKKFKTGIKYTDGTEAELPKSVICEMILTWERQQGRTHLESGGAKIPNLDMYNKGFTSKAMTEGAKRTQPITEENITKLRGMLDSYDKAWIERSRHLFNDVAQKAINETSLTLVGRELAKAKNYIRLFVDRDFVHSDIEGLKFDATIEGSGSLKSVVPNAKQPVILRGLNENVHDQIDFTAKYYGLAIPLRNFNKVYNISVRDESGNISSVKEMLGKKFGSKIQKEVIEQSIKDLQTPRERSYNIFSRVRGKWLNATFWGNISSMLKQTTSYWTASSSLSEKSLVKGLGAYVGNTKATKTEISRYTGTLYKREQGFSTVELGDRAERKRLSGLSNSVDKFVNRNMPVLKRVPERLRPSNWLQAMDCSVAAALWEACKVEVSDVRGISAESENYFKEVTDLYDQVIEETQSNYDVLHRPEALKNTNPITQAVTMFQTDNLQQTGIIVNAYNDLKTKSEAYKKNKNKETSEALSSAKKRFGKAVKSRLYSAVWLAFATMAGQLLLRKFRDYKDEEENDITLESVAKRVLMNMGEDMLGVLVPVGGNLIMQAADAWNYGYDFAAEPAFDVIQDFIESSSGLYKALTEDEKDSEKIIKKLSDLVPSASNITGIPVKNITDLFKAVKGYATDIVQADFAHDIGEITSSKALFSYADLASSIASGDKKQEERILNYYENNNKKVDKGSLTKAIKSAYVSCLVDEPLKAENVKNRLVSDYDYDSDAFKDWICEEFFDALTKDSDYAKEIEQAAKKSKPIVNVTALGNVEKWYKDAYEKGDNAEELKKVLNSEYRIDMSRFNQWEREVDKNVGK